MATISPLDELMHIDYLLRGAGPGFLRMSDRFSQEAMDEISCRRHPSQPLPACGARPYRPEDYSWEGRNLASSHSPYYYVATGVVARGLRAVLPGDSIVTWARALGSVWLVAGLALILASARRLAVSDWAVVPFLAVLALSPSTQHAATTVNPDATSVFAGGLVLLATLRALQRDGSAWVVLGASLVAMLLDPGNLLVILAAAAVATVAAGHTLRERVGIVAPLAVGAVAAETANRLLVRALGAVDYTGNPQDVLFSIDGIKGPMLWGEGTLFAMLPPTKGYLFPEMATDAHVVAVAAATALAAAAIVAVGLGFGPRPRLDLLSVAATAGLGTLVLGGPLLVLTRFVFSSSYFPIPARYGLSLVPIVAIAGGAAFATRPARAVVWTVAAALASTALASLL